MHHPSTTNLLLLLLSAAASTAKADNNSQPTPKSGLDASWASPARETAAAAARGHEFVDQQLALGWSPRPTQAPKPLLGRMMVPRADDFTLGPQTCGFVPGTAGSESLFQFIWLDLVCRVSRVSVIPLSVSVVLFRALKMRWDD